MHAGDPYIGLTALRDRAHRASLKRSIRPDVLQSVAALVFGAIFLAISMWWFAADTRMPNGDNGKHLNFAFQYYDRMRDGAPFAFFTDWTQYPPLVHLVGVLGIAVGGLGITQVGIAENLVFVPMLVLGCYGAGSVAFDRRVGALAAIFALAAPMVISLFHVFMLDAPTAALVAMSVWLLLASDRFKHVGFTIAAAVFVALGCHAKGTFALFVAGLILVLVVRGGWRHWSNVLLFGAVTAMLVLPWYVEHYDDLTALTSGATSGAQPVNWYGSTPYPDRWTFENFTWYFWNLINNQLYLPLTTFFLVGVGAAAVALWRRARAPAPSEETTHTRYLPELLAGGLVGYLGMSYINLDDPRYTLPCLVYVALLATWWISRLGSRGRLIATGALVLVFAVNTGLQNFTVGNPIRITTPKTVQSPIGEYSATVVSPSGYFEGAPMRGGLRPDMLDLLRRARADGIEEVIFQPESMNIGGNNLFALAVVARAANVKVPGFTVDLIGPDDVFLFRASPRDVETPPCMDAKGGDGTGIYMTRGQPFTEGVALYCPPKL